MRNKRRTVNKEDILREINKGLPNLSQGKAKKILETMIEVISDAMSKGDKVTLSGFGTFYVGSRQEKKGTNPRTGQPIVIPAAQVPKFRPASELKKAVK